MVPPPDYRTFVRLYTMWFCCSFKKKKIAEKGMYGKARSALQPWITPPYPDVTALFPSPLFPSRPTILSRWNEKKIERENGGKISLSAAPSIEYKVEHATKRSTPILRLRYLEGFQVAKR